MTTTAAPRKAAREPLEVLCTILFDRERSTQFNEVYRAASDSEVGRVYAVTFAVADARWSCDCPARVSCKHIARSARLRRVRWWSALWAGQPAAVLRRHRAHYEALERDGMADADALAAIDYLTIALSREGVAA